MRTSVETLSQVEVEVAVEIPAEIVERKINEEVQRLRRKAHVRGFRPGKAPVGLVRRLYAKQIDDETISKLVDETIGDALGAVARPTVGEPSLKVEALKDGFPLHYSLRVQVTPKITLSHWKDIEVCIAPLTVDPAALDAQLAEMQRGQAERVPVEDRGAELGDVLLVNTRRVPPEASDEPADRDEDEDEDDRWLAYETAFRLGAANVISGFSDGVVGVRTGETRDVVVHAPEDDEDGADTADVTLRVEVVGHFTEDIPDLDDLATDLGYESVEELRTEVAAKQQKAAEAQYDSELAERVVAVLLERHPFEVPPAMVQAIFDHHMQQMIERMMARGHPDKESDRVMRQRVNTVLEDAERYAKRQLALQALAEQEKITIDDAAIEAEIAAMIQAGVADADSYEEEEARETLRASLQSRAALDLLISSAKITNTQAAPDASVDGATASEASVGEGSAAASEPEARAEPPEAAALEPDARAATDEATE